MPKGRPRTDFIVALPVKAGDSRLQKLGRRAEVIEFLSKQPEKRAHISALEKLLGRTRARHVCLKLEAEKHIERIRIDTPRG